MTFLEERRRAIAFADCYKRPRTASMRALGAVLHPAAITEAWYAANCPPKLDARRSGVPLRTRVRWHVANALRGACRS